MSGSPEDALGVGETLWLQQVQPTFPLPLLAEGPHQNRRYGYGTLFRANFCYFRCSAVVLGLQYEVPTVPQSRALLYSPPAVL